MLDDEKTYVKLDKDPTPSYKKSWCASSLDLKIKEK